MNKTTEHRIKCYKCKEYFDSVTIFKNNQDEDYKNEKWFCEKCFNVECYNKGRLEAMKEELSFWEKSGFTETLLGFPLIKERIASIQEEIKLIEEKI